MLARHPGLTLENCASGGMRMDYARMIALVEGSVPHELIGRQGASRVLLKPAVRAPVVPLVGEACFVAAHQRLDLYGHLAVVQLEDHVPGRVPERDQTARRAGISP